MNKKIIQCITVFTLLLIYLVRMPSAVWAEGEFYTDYTVSYAVSTTGATIVTQQVTLTNKLTNLYPKEYAITIDSLRISNIIAKDDAGNINPTISQTDGKTYIQLAFNKEVVGVGKQLSFTLRYESLDFAQKHGNIWEINIPGVENDENLRSYDVSLQVPSSFGPNAYTVPIPSNGRRWTRSQMIRGGISAAYGNAQTFSLSLTYFLKNNSLAKQIQEIALPPDTAYQKVAISTLDPKPMTVVADQDGNWLARYELLPGAKIQIKAQLLVTITLTPRLEFFDPVENTDVYLKSMPFWDVDNESIQNIVKQYKTPREIYNFVVSTLSYNYERINTSPKRQGAASALENPADALCMEFTDLFIALSRAAGIAAREVVGFAYTDNPKLRPLSLASDILHSWPEYFDPETKRWIPVDPTWGNTTGGVNYFDKLDFNHIAFAIRGQESDYPYPAGSYREAGRSGKDVQVEFSDAVPVKIAKANAVFTIPKTVIAGFPFSGTIEIENTSGVSMPEAQVVIESPKHSFFSQDTLYNLPPFAKISYPVSFTTWNDVPFGVKDQVTVTINGEVFVHSFTTQSIIWIVIAIVLMVSFVFIIGFRLLQKRKHFHDR